MYRKQGIIDMTKSVVYLKQALKHICPATETVPCGDEYFCTRCNAVLNEQVGFNPEFGSWTCAKCGQELYGDVYEGERYPGVLWYCDECQSLMNKQSGFSDQSDTWICVECGFSNVLDTIIDSAPITRHRSQKHRSND